MAFNNSLLLSVSCAESFTVICLSVMPDESLKFSVSDTDKCLEWTRGHLKTMCHLFYTKCKYKRYKNVWNFNAE